MNTQNQIKEVEILHTKVQKVAEFIALFESAEEKLQKQEQQINEQLLQFKTVLADFQNILTEAGAARWRVQLQQSEEHLKSIRYATDEFVRNSAESHECFNKVHERFNKTADNAIKDLSQTIHSFRMEDFQNVSTYSIETITDTCAASLDKMKDVVKWFHWRNIVLVFSITIVVTMITGLYINDEWPWQSHQQAMQQRQLATAVETVWPDLTIPDQQQILHTDAENIA